MMQLLLPLTGQSSWTAEEQTSLQDENTTSSYTPGGSWHDHTISIHTTSASKQKYPWAGILQLVKEGWRWRGHAEGHIWTTSSEIWKQRHSLGVMQSRSEHEQRPPECQDRILKKSSVTYEPRNKKLCTPIEKNMLFISDRNVPPICVHLITQ